MSGHSKWSQIKRQKGVTDARRSKLFTKLGREITVAARHGGPQVSENAALRLAMGRARQANMPKETIKRAVDRASGAGGGGDWQEVRYEAYGPGGAALLIDTLTDNRNRTVADVRSALTKMGGSMGETGSVAWHFALKGVITIDVVAGLDGDAIALEAIDAGAEDVEVEDGLIEVVTEPGGVEEVRDALVKSGISVASAEVVMQPVTRTELEASKARSVLKLIDALEDLDDVQRVYTNGEFPDSVLVEA